MTIYKSECPELKLKKKDGCVLKAKIKSSLDSYEYFKAIFDSEILEVREEFMVIYLNTDGNTIGWFKAGIGGIGAVYVDPRLILKMGLECGATSMILAHNHPSGQLNPSSQDMDITRKIKQAGEIMNIILFDHIILTTEGYYSFADNGNIF